MIFLFFIIFKIISLSPCSYLSRLPSDFSLSSSSPSIQVASRSCPYKLKPLFPLSFSKKLLSRYKYRQFNKKIRRIRSLSIIHGDTLLRHPFYFSSASSSGLDIFLHLQPFLDFISPSFPVILNQNSFQQLSFLCLELIPSQTLLSNKNKIFLINHIYHALKQLIFPDLQEQFFLYQLSLKIKDLIMNDLPLTRFQRVEDEDLQNSAIAFPHPTLFLHKDLICQQTPPSFTSSVIGTCQDSVIQKKYLIKLAPFRSLPENSLNPPFKIILSPFFYGHLSIEKESQLPLFKTSQTVYLPLSLLALKNLQSFQEQNFYAPIVSHITSEYISTHYETAFTLYPRHIEDFVFFGHPSPQHTSLIDSHIDLYISFLTHHHLFSASTYQIDLLKQQAFLTPPQYYSDWERYISQALHLQQQEQSFSSSSQTLYLPWLIQQLIHLSFTSFHLSIHDLFKQDCIGTFLKYLYYSPTEISFQPLFQTQPIDPSDFCHFQNIIDSFIVSPCSFSHRFTWLESSLEISDRPIQIRLYPSDNALFEQIEKPIVFSQNILDLILYELSFLDDSDEAEISIFQHNKRTTFFLKRKSQKSWSLIHANIHLTSLSSHPRLLIVHKINCFQLFPLVAFLSRYHHWKSLMRGWCQPSALILFYWTDSHFENLHPIIEGTYTLPACFSSAHTSDFQSLSILKIHEPSFVSSALVDEKGHFLSLIYRHSPFFKKFSSSLIELIEREKLFFQIPYSLYQKFNSSFEPPDTHVQDILYQLFLSYIAKCFLEKDHFSCPDIPIEFLLSKHNYCTYTPSPDISRFMDDSTVFFLTVISVPFVDCQGSLTTLQDRKSWINQLSPEDSISHLSPKEQKTILSTFRIKENHLSRQSSTLCPLTSLTPQQRSLVKHLETLIHALESSLSKKKSIPPLALSFYWAPSDSISLAFFNNASMSIKMNVCLFDRPEILFKTFLHETTHYVEFITRTRPEKLFNTDGDRLFWRNKYLTHHEKGRFSFYYKTLNLFFLSFILQSQDLSLKQALIPLPEHPSLAFYSTSLFA